MLVPTHYREIVYGWMEGRKEGRKEERKEGRKEAVSVVSG